GGGGVGALATYLMVHTRRAGLRRLARNAKLSVAGRGAATKEVERKHSWLAIAAAVAREMSGDS
nr:hypothetical protein [Streptomyces sp. DSM 41633]